MSSNEKKSATLGVPYGTASHRLRKMILFDLLRRHKENTCHVCGSEILTSGELSIEHKKPWEGVSAELFWDLTNIAFSHTQCNKPHTYRGGSPRKIVAPQGREWCGAKKHFVSKHLFTAGAKGECSSCKSERNSQRKRV